MNLRGGGPPTLGGTRASADGRVHAGELKLGSHATAFISYRHAGFRGRDRGGRARSGGPDSRVVRAQLTDGMKTSSARLLIFLERPPDQK